MEAMQKVHNEVEEAKENMDIYLSFQSFDKNLRQPIKQWCKHLNKFNSQT